MSEWQPINTENTGLYWMRYHVVEDGKPAIHWNAEIVLIRDGDVHRIEWCALDAPDYVDAETFGTGIEFPKDKQVQDDE